MRTYFENTSCLHLFAPSTLVYPEGNAYEIRSLNLSLLLHPETGARMVSCDSPRTIRKKEKRAHTSHVGYLFHRGWWWHTQNSFGGYVSGRYCEHFLPLRPSIFSPFCCSGIDLLIHPKWQLQTQRLAALCQWKTYYLNIIKAVVRSFPRVATLFGLRVVDILGQE
jgi:hypothetical protein